MQVYQAYYPMIDIHNLKLLIYNRILKGTLREFLKPEGLAIPGKHPDMNFFKFHSHVVSLFQIEYYKKSVNEMIDLILSEIKNGLVILLQVNKLKNSRLICLKFNLK